MSYQEKIGEAKVLMDRAKEILNDKEASVEDKEKVEPLMEQAKALKAEAIQLKDIETSFYAEIEERGLEIVPPDPAASSEDLEGEFKDWADFLYSSWIANHKEASIRRVDPRLKYFKDDREEGMGERETKVMTEGVGASGGFLVPVEFMAQVQAIAASQGLIRPGATVIRMRRRQIQMPVLDQTGTTAGVPHWFGGMQFYWAEEATEKTHTEAEWRDVTLTAHKLIGYTTASDELVDDAAVSLADFISGPLGFAGGVNWMEDFSFLQGSGAGQPLGIINSGATITVNRTATLPPIGYGDLCDMVENFLPSGRGQWLITQSALSDLLQLSGPTGNPSYVWGNAVNGAPASLLGYPVRFVEKLPRIGTTGDVLLIDPMYYLIGDRQATTIESTQYDLWRFDKTSWRVVHRVDGQPWLSAPLTYQDGTTQVSPFVMLGAKST